MKKIKPFIFKQFTIEQDKCLMKVGTDGVLLGGWVPRKLQVNSVLDIGTGSGLIALMLAQKYPQSKIIGIEPDPGSFQQAVQNFFNSPWNHNLQAVESSLEQYCLSGKEKFDLIVSNPPFHEEAILSTNPGKVAAKSTNTLAFDKLIECSSKMLNSTGNFVMIAPSRYEDKLIELSRLNGLSLVQMTRVRGTTSSPVKRLLLFFSKIDTLDPKIDELFLEITRHHFSKEYAELTKDYYIHL